MFKLPFRLTLRGLLLSGKDRDKAEAIHTLTGQELERRLLDIEHADKESNEYKLKTLELDRKYDKITELDYEKEKATVLDEPWVGYRDYGLETKDDKTGFWFEFDWNQAFITKLKSEGYEGTSDEQLVRKWYAELCRVVALDEGLNLDLFDGEQDASGGPSRKKRNADGTVDYS